MRSWEHKVGKALQGSLDEVIIEIGQVTFSRRDMIEKLRCGNFAAGRRLNRALKKFDPKGVKELARRVDLPSLLRVKSVGVTTIYVWMCILHHFKVNPEKWLDSDVNVPTAYGKVKARKKIREGRRKE